MVFQMNLADELPFIPPVVQGETHDSLALSFTTFQSVKLKRSPDQDPWSGRQRRLIKSGTRLVIQRGSSPGQKSKKGAWNNMTWRNVGIFV